MSIKVVFLDDSKSVLKTISLLVSELVENGEIEIELFENSESFAENLRHASIDFDILFSDINMPIMSGYDIAKLARSLPQFSNKLIIALTTEMTTESKKLGKDSGFNGWITKVSSPEVMKSAVLTTIRSAKSRLANRS